MIILPEYMTARSIRRLVEVTAEMKMAEDDEVICDAGATKFVDPLGLCLFVHAARSLRNDGQQVRLVNTSQDINGYMARMDVFRRAGIHFEETFTRHSRRHSLVEVTEISELGDSERVASQLATVITGGAPDDGVDPEGMQPSNRDRLGYALNYVFNEMLDNSLTHARRGGGGCVVYAAAQYYPKPGRVRLAVADDGCGFLRSLRDHQDLHARDDVSAITLALEPGVSCNPHVDLQLKTHNLGIGLTVCSEFVEKAGGSWTIGSGAGVVEGRGTGRSGFGLRERWNGACFFAEFDRTRALSVNMTEIFDRLRRQTETDEVDLDFLG